MPPRTPSLFSSADPAPVAPVPSILAHCDGGARGNPGPAGYGAEITDAQGNVLAELSEFLGFRTNNFAEYSGLLATLQYALDHGHRSLKVISDSELMVKQIQGKYKVKSPDLLPLYQEAKRRISKLDHFEISHALRHKNKAADRLANEAMDRGMKRGTPAEGQPVIAAPASNGPTSRNDVQSLPLRAIPYPAQALPAPSAPAALDPAPKAAPLPTRATHAPIILTPERPQPAVSKSGQKTTPPTSEQEPAGPTMLRGFVRNGAVYLLGSEKLPDGTFVKIIPE